MTTPASTPAIPVFRAVLLPGLALTALVGLIAIFLQGYALVLQEREEATATLQRIGDVAVPALERALWDVNEPQIEVLLDGISQMREVAWVELVDERQLHRVRGTLPAATEMERRYPLALKGADGVPLGELHVVLNGEIGLERAKARVLRGSLTLLLSLSIAVALLVHLLNEHLVRPLRRLSAGVEAYSPDKDVPPSGRALDEAAEGTLEVRKLAEALDLMHLRIRRDSEEITHLSEDLESQQGRMEAVVQQRTAELEEKNRELATQAASLESLANTDALTGAANRRKLLDLGRRECARSLRDVRPLAVLAIDIDHFKQVNDSYGHAAGDLVLKVVVACCQSQLRNNDVLGRLGGEEFAIVLPGADARSGLRVAERIRERIANTPVVLDGRTVRVTVSIGMATFDGVKPFEALLADADAALYQAKRDGRNRVVAGAGPTA